MNNVVSRAKVATNHRAAFSKRLCTAMEKNGHEVGPTMLARLFNSYYQGKAVSVHAARKWLVGEAIPTQEKVATLARIFNVAPDWLAFGVIRDAKTMSDLTSDEARLIAEVRQLDAGEAGLAGQIVSLLLKRKSTNRERIKT